MKTKFCSVKVKSGSAYESPALLRIIEINTGLNLLIDSVAEDIAIRTMGHEVESYTIGPGNDDNTFEAPDWGSFDWN